MIVDTSLGRTLESARTFSLFSYAMSHGLLLLRSGKTNEHKTRVDILFHDVRVMEIRAWFKGLLIREALPAAIASRLSNPSDMIEIGNKVYLLEAAGWQGFVVGGILTTCEDDGEMFARSPLLGPEIP
jgi:hypothetical protein